MKCSQALIEYLTKKSSLYNTDDKTQFEMGAKLFVKLFTSGPSLQIRKVVLNNQLVHDSLPLFRHGIT